MIYQGEKPQILEAYPHIIQLPILWGDMDGMNHVNNTRYFRYQETARIEFIRTHLNGFEDPGIPNLKQGLALAETRCRFKVSLTYPDTILVASAVSKIEAHQFIVKHEIYSLSKKFVVAEGDARMVYFDFSERKKQDIDGEFLALLESLQAVS